MLLDTGLRNITCLLRPFRTGLIDNIGVSVGRVAPSFENIPTALKHVVHQCACGENNPHQFYGNMQGICKHCFSTRVILLGIQTRIEAIEYLGGQCIECGYHNCISALEFHHKDPAIKDNSALRRIGSISWERRKRELDRCILVCSNCHRWIHWNNYTGASIDPALSNFLIRSPTVDVSNDLEIFPSGFNNPT